MIKHFITAFFLLLTLSACKDDPRAISTQTSPGGVDYVLVQVPGQEAVAIQVAWDTDWAFRDGRKQAVPYVGSELVLSGGAEGYTAAEAGELFADLNATGQIFATPDYVFGYLGFDKPDMEEVIALANAHLRAPALGENWLERITTGLARTFAESGAQPATQGFIAIRRAVLGDQPLQQALSLSDAGMFEAVTRADVQAWVDEVITRNPFALVIAGDLTPTEAGTAIDALFAGLPAGNGIPVRNVSADFSPRRILLHRPDAGTGVLTFIAPLPPTSAGEPADEFADIILAQAFGGGDQSALFKSLRTEMRASYGFQAGIDGYIRNQRFLYITGQVEPERLAEAEQVVRDSYTAFRENGPPGALEDYKAPLNQGVKQGQSDVDSLSTSALYALLDGMSPQIPLRLEAELDSLTTDRLTNRLQAAFPEASGFLMLAVSPDAGSLPGACVITTPEEASGC